MPRLIPSSSPFLFYDTITPPLFVNNQASQQLFNEAMHHKMDSLEALYSASIGQFLS